MKLSSRIFFKCYATIKLTKYTCGPNINSFEGKSDDKLLIIKGGKMRINQMLTLFLLFTQVEVISQLFPGYFWKQGYVSGCKQTPQTRRQI